MKTEKQPYVPTYKEVETLRSMRREFSVFTDFETASKNYEKGKEEVRVWIDEKVSRLEKMKSDLKKLG